MGESGRCNVVIEEGRKREGVRGEVRQGVDEGTEDSKKKGLKKMEKMVGNCT